MLRFDSISSEKVAKNLFSIPYMILKKKTTLEIYVWKGVDKYLQGLVLMCQVSIGGFMGTTDLFDLLMGLLQLILQVLEGGL